MLVTVKCLQLAVLKSGYQGYSYRFSCLLSNFRQIQKESVKRCQSIRTELGQIQGVRGDRKSICLNLDGIFLVALMAEFLVCQSLCSLQLSKISKGGLQMVDRILMSCEYQEHKPSCSVPLQLEGYLLEGTLHLFVCCCAINTSGSCSQIGRQT